MDYPGLEDFLIAAEVVLGLPAEELRYATDLALAESALHAPQATFGGEDFYPRVVAKAAVLCSRIIRNHPLPDGNKRTALLLMLDFVERNGFIWTDPAGGDDEIATAIEDLASGALSEAEFAAWLTARVAE